MFFTQYPQKVWGMKIEDMMADWAPQRIELRDFGTFTTKIRDARKGRNPSTGTEIDIKKKAFVHYNPGKNLKKKLNER